MAATAIPFIVKFMPPAPAPTRPSLLTPDAPERALLMAFDASDTFSKVWKDIQKSYDGAYPADERARTSFARLQSPIGVDIILSWTVGALFQPSQTLQERTLYMQLVAVDHQSSIAPGSALQPLGYKKRSFADLTPATQQAVKRRKLEESRYGQPLDTLDADTPVISREEEVVGGAVEGQANGTGQQVDKDGFKIPAKIQKRQAPPSQRQKAPTNPSPALAALRERTAADAAATKLAKQAASRTDIESPRDPNGSHDGSPARSSDVVAKSKAIPTPGLSEDHTVKDGATKSAARRQVVAAPPSRSALRQNTLPFESAKSISVEDPIEDEDDEEEDEEEDEEAAKPRTTTAITPQPGSKPRPSTSNAAVSSDAASTSNLQPNDESALLRSPSDSPPPTRKGLWTAEEDKILLRGVRRGYSGKQLTQMRGLYRTSDGIKHRRQKLMEKYPGGIIPPTDEYYEGETPRKDSNASRDSRSVSTASAWTAQDVSTVKSAMAQGLLTSEIQQMHFPDRSEESVRKKAAAVRDYVFRGEEGKDTFPKDKIRLPGWNTEHDLRLRRVFNEGGMTAQQARKQYFASFSVEVVKKKMDAYEKQMAKSGHKRLSTNVSSQLSPSAGRERPSRSAESREKSVQDSEAEAEAEESSASSEDEELPLGPSPRVVVTYSKQQSALRAQANAATNKRKGKDRAGLAPSSAAESTPRVPSSSQDLKQTEEASTASSEEGSDDSDEEDEEDEEDGDDQPVQQDQVADSEQNDERSEDEATSSEDDESEPDLEKLERQLQSQVETEAEAVEPEHPDEIPMDVNPQGAALDSPVTSKSASSSKSGSSGRLRSVNGAATRYTQRVANKMREFRQGRDSPTHSRPSPTKPGQHATSGSQYQSLTKPESIGEVEPWIPFEDRPQNAKGEINVGRRHHPFYMKSNHPWVQSEDELWREARRLAKPEWSEDMYRYIRDNNLILMRVSAGDSQDVDRLRRKMLHERKIRRKKMGLLPLWSLRRGRKLLGTAQVDGEDEHDSEYEPEEEEDDRADYQGMLKEQFREKADSDVEMDDGLQVDDVDNNRAIEEVQDGDSDNNIDATTKQANGEDAETESDTELPTVPPNAPLEEVTAPTDAELQQLDHSDEEGVVYDGNESFVFQRRQPHMKRSNARPNLPTPSSSVRPSARPDKMQSKKAGTEQKSTPSRQVENGVENGEVHKAAKSKKPKRRHSKKDATEHPSSTAPDAGKQDDRTAMPPPPSIPQREPDLTLQRQDSISSSILTSEPSSTSHGISADGSQVSRRGSRRRKKSEGKRQSLADVFPPAQVGGDHVMISATPEDQQSSSVMSHDQSASSQLPGADTQEVHDSIDARTLTPANSPSKKDATLPRSAPNGSLKPEDEAPQSTAGSDGTRKSGGLLNWGWFRKHAHIPPAPKQQNSGGLQPVVMPYQDDDDDEDAGSSDDDD